jgi:hypothetical protein
VSKWKIRSHNGAGEKQLSTTDVTETLQTDDMSSKFIVTVLVCIVLRITSYHITSHFWRVVCFELMVILEKLLINSYTS